MKHKNPFRALSKAELALWSLSAAAVIGSFLFSSSSDYLTLAASLIGVTALIFVAKGYVIGQVLTIVFSLFYGVISFCFQYYGEMITYLGMTSPIAILTAISWYRHPYQKTAEVAVGWVTRRQAAAIFVLAVIVTGAFYFILEALGTANLFFSTVSVATSFLASALTLKRSPYYAAGYAANDIILVVLWILASAEDASYFPMVVCFLAFFINDLYGFWNWQRIKKRQMEQG